MYFVRFQAYLFPFSTFYNFSISVNLFSYPFSFDVMLLFFCFHEDLLVLGLLKILLSTQEYKFIFLFLLKHLLILFTFFF